MISAGCRICGSENIRKNGKTLAGAQKYHCKTCNFYGTLVTQEEKQKKKEELMEKFLYERMSMRGIARSLSVSRMRLKLFIKKKKSRNLQPKL